MAIVATRSQAREPVCLRFVEGVMGVRRGSRLGPVRRDNRLNLLSWRLHVDSTGRQPDEGKLFMNKVAAIPDFELPQVVTDDTMTNGYLGNVVELAIVTGDHRKTMEGMVRLGIGPWRVYTFSPATVIRTDLSGRTGLVHHQGLFRDLRQYHLGVDGAR